MMIIRNLKYTSILILAFYSNSSGAQNIHVAHCLQGCPAGTSETNELVIRHLFAVSLNEQTGLADWLSYRVIDGSIGIASLLPREWNNDELARNSIQFEPLVGEELVIGRPRSTSSPESSYSVNETVINSSDRGRLVPMSSFAKSSYWPDLNLLSIMSLIKNDMRVGPWARLDQRANHLVQQTGEAYVLVGPIYGNNQSVGYVGSRNIPSAFFKIIANAQGDISAFVFGQNLAQHTKYCAQLSDIETVESLTGLEFFPRVSNWPLGSLDAQLGC